MFGAHFPCGPRLRPRKIVLKSIKFSFHKGPRCKSALSRDGAAENIKYKSNSCAIIVGRLELFRCEFSRRGKAPHLRFCPLFSRNVACFADFVFVSYQRRIETLSAYPFLSVYVLILLLNPQRDTKRLYIIVL